MSDIDIDIRKDYIITVLQGGVPLGTGRILSNPKGGFVSAIIPGRNEGKNEEKTINVKALFINSAGGLTFDIGLAPTPTPPRRTTPPSP